MAYGFMIYFILYCRDETPVPRSRGKALPIDVDDGGGYESPDSIMDSDEDSEEEEVNSLLD